MTTLSPTTGSGTKSSRFPTYAGNREGWANEILGVLQPRLAGLGITMPDGRTVRIGVTPLSRTTLGVCHPARLSTSGTVNFISLCTKQASADELVYTLIHEYLHAADDCMSGHRNRWARWAALLGMKAKGHECNALGRDLIHDALRAVGVPVQHEPSKPGLAALSVPSQIRVQCPGCEQHAYIPRKAFEDGYALRCGPCSTLMQEARK